MDNPEVWALIEDMTDYGWSNDILECVGRILDVYIYDASSVTYCCSMTPSYALYYIHLITEKGDWNNMPKRFYECLMDWESVYLADAPVRYYTKYAVDGAEVIQPTELPAGRMGRWQVDGWDWDAIRAEAEDYDEALMDLVVQAVRESGL